MAYVTFLTCLAAVFTPLVDDPARFFASFGAAEHQEIRRSLLLRREVPLTVNNAQIPLQILDL